MLPLLNTQLLKGIQYTGLIHLSKKLWISSSQKIINRKIKKYFVLADFIEENLERTNSSLKTSFFYPVYFPESNSNEPSEVKIRNEFHVCIPVAVDIARWDYNSLMDDIASNGFP